jgi:N-acetylglucosamine malate deacetylase 2
MVRTLLLIFAHPDDETFLTGGSVCKYAEAGTRVVLATATRGESGKPGVPALCSTEDLPATRERELRQAAAILGIADLHLLGYRDRDLGAAPPDEIRNHLVALIRRERPQVVVSFDPNGGNLHPDHIAISRFAGDAVTAAGDPRWYPGGPPAYEVPRFVWVPGRRPWQLVREANLAACPGIDFVIDVGAYAGRKLEALRTHATQHQSVERNFLSQPDRDRLLGIEVYRQALGPRLLSRPAADLFDGLEEIPAPGHPA